MYWKLETYKYKIFFVKYRVDKGEVKIEYCSTQMVFSDYFTKLLNGKVFKLYRELIMDYKPTSSLKRVGKRVEL